MAEKFKIQRVEDDIEKANEEKVAETGLLPSHDTDQPLSCPPMYRGDSMILHLMALYIAPARLLVEAHQMSQSLNLSYICIF